MTSQQKIASAVMSLHHNATLPLCPKLSGLDYDELDYLNRMFVDFKTYELELLINEDPNFIALKPYLPVNLYGRSGATVALEGLNGTLYEVDVPEEDVDEVCEALANFNNWVKDECRNYENFCLSYVRAWEAQELRERSDKWTAFYAGASGKFDTFEEWEAQIRKARVPRL